MKEDNSSIKILSNLAQLDMDAVLAYDQAIENIDQSEVEIIEALESFQDDHLRHVDELSEMIRELGGASREFKRGAKGFVIEGMTKIMSKVGTRGALVAMIQNEMLTNGSYRAAVSAELPAKAKALVKANYQDEQRHIAFIKQALKEKFGMAEEDVTRPTQDNLDEAQSF